MSDDLPQPWVSWVKIRDESDAPVGFELHGPVLLLGRFADCEQATLFGLTDDDMRRYGYERCYCSPLDRYAPVEDCAAHGHLVPQRELQLCLTGME